MRSIPCAMTWELFRCNGWGMLAAGLGGNLMPALIFNALRHDGAIDHSPDAGFVTMHVTFVLINMFVFGAAVFGTQLQFARMYPLPVRTGMLVAWRLLPATAAIVIQGTLSAAALNAAFDLGWPIWGPAWFAAVAFALLMATFWLLENSRWMPVGIAAVGAMLGLWFKSRYGGLFSTPSQMWLAMTPAEVATLCAGAVAAYATGVFAVSRNRCGESLRPLVTPSSVAWIAGPSPTAARPFKSAAHAQFWYDWRRAGWGFPVVVACGVAVGLLIWAVFVRDLGDLVKGFAGGGAVLPFAALLCGLMLGHPGTSPTRGDLGNFCAVRPVTSGELARGQLRLTAASVVAGWLVWAIPFALIVFPLLSVGRIAPPAALADLGWWYPPAILAGSWTLATAAAAMVLTGRSQLIAIVITGFFVAGMALVYLRTVLPPAILSTLPTVLGVVIALVVLAGTAWAFQQAWRRRLTEPAVLGAALVVGLAGVASAIGVSVFTPVPSPLAAAIFLGEWSLLAVAPVATFPLALAWNRVR